jgi:AcrR family transcriptional regulator
LLDAAEQLMLKHGYAAVTSRRVAEQAGLKAALVHYYFRNMDELFIELYRRRAEAGLQLQREALASGRPLRVLWDFSADSEAAAFFVEMTAVANHRKAVRSEFVRYAEQFRDMNLAIVAAVFERNRITTDVITPAVMTLAMTGMSVVIGIENTLGIDRGHAETIAFVERCLELLEHERGLPPLSAPERSAQ